LKENWREKKFKNGVKIFIDFKSINKYKGGAITFSQTCKKDTRTMEKGNTGCSTENVYPQRVRKNFGF